MSSATSRPVAGSTGTWPDTKTGPRRSRRPPGCRALRPPARVRPRCGCPQRVAHCRTSTPASAIACLTWRSSRSRHETPRPRAPRRRARRDRLGEVGQGAGAAGRDHRDRCGRAHARQELSVESVLGAVPVHAGEQDLPRPAPGRLSSPGHCLDAGRLSTAIEVHLPTGAVAATAGSIATTMHWLPNRAASVRDQLRVADGRRVDRHLVGTGRQDRIHVRLRTGARLRW